MILEQLRQEVLTAANSLRDYGLVWMAGGTICVRDPESGNIVVTPSGLDYSELGPADMIVVDIDMEVVDGAYRPSVATNLWTAILRARPDVHAVVHCHSPYATAFSVVDQPIPIITETQADWFGQPIRVARYAHIEDEHFVTAPVEALGDGFGVLLGQHGPITIGETLHNALERAVTLEEAAKTYSVARGLGEPLVFTTLQSQRSFDYYQNRYGQR
jgi:L-ribulose-5-phosphate 4-epimerase